MDMGAGVVDFEEFKSIVGSNLRSELWCAIPYNPYRI
jgi:hypothetical protein